MKKEIKTWDELYEHYLSNDNVHKTYVEKKGDSKYTFEEAVHEMVCLWECMMYSSPEDYVECNNFLDELVAVLNN